MFAIDHGYFMGPTSGLEDPRKTIVPLLPHADSLMLSRGILQNSIPKRTNIPIVLRVSSGNSILNEDLSNEKLCVSIEDAIRLNASAVAFSIYIGGAYEHQTIVEFSKLVNDAHGNDQPEFGRDTLVTSALGTLGEMLEFDQDPTSTFSVIKVTTSEPLFAKQLAEVTLAELEALNRFYKSQTVNEKTSFIANRIASVENDLKSSETRLKEFNERNRQISSPALELEQGRLARDVEIQKGIYLTLKQQYELAKIEEVQEASIVQVLDKPQVPLGPTNKNLKRSVLLAGILGIGLGILV